MTNVATIILNWNDANATIRCASSVLRAFEVKKDVEASNVLYIVDNGSFKQHQDRLSAWCSEQVSGNVYLVVNDSNLGYSGGMNTGISCALADEPDFLWLLNNDLEVDVNSISALLAFSTKNQAAVAVGCTVIDHLSGKVQSAGGYRYYPWLGYSKALKAGVDIKQLSDSEDLEPDYIDGAAVWLNGSFLKEIGGLPEVHFLYFEELELQQKLRESDVLGICPGAIVSHVGGGSTKQSDMEDRSTYHAALSAFHYTRHYHPWWLPTVILARMVGISLRSILLRRPKLIMATIRALKDFIWPSMASQARK